MHSDMQSGWNRQEKSQFVSEQLTWLPQFLPCCSPHPTSAVFHSINYSNGHLHSINVCGCVCVFVFGKSLCRQLQIAPKVIAQLKKLFPGHGFLFLKTSSVSLAPEIDVLITVFLLNPRGISSSCLCPTVSLFSCLSCSLIVRLIPKGLSTTTEDVKGASSGAGLVRF